MTDQNYIARWFCRDAGTAIMVGYQTPDGAHYLTTVIQPTPAGHSLTLHVN